MTEDAILTPRQRARAGAMQDIKRIAKDQLATDGGAALSLRAIARELGIVSSAVYRYVPSRDELLTMLIVDAYNSLGDAVEAAEARCDRADLRGRWLAICHAVREWAVTNRAEYALLYGGPVPGYTAPPERTVEPGSRVIMLLVNLFCEIDETVGLPVRAPVLSPALHEDFERVRAGLGITISDDMLACGILAWSALFGLISFEIFGQYNGSVTDHPAHFEHQLGMLSTLIGLPPLA